MRDHGAAPGEWGESWSEVMGRAQAGDMRAREALLGSVTPFVRSIAWRSLRNATDVEEVVQEVLLTIHQIADSYDRDRPFAPWLVAIARRRVVDRIRANKNHMKRMDALAQDMLLQPAWTPSPFEIDEYGELYQAIAALPKRQRQAIRMLKLKQMSLKEAAAATGLSIAALKVSSHRAIKGLQAAMRPVECCP
jgi:RNA polymerase sigma-70 factor, ECF subfamily